MMLRSVLSGLFLLFYSITLVWAGVYSPPGLYDVEHQTFDNGLQVILKPRDTARTVSIRLAVGVGFSDFPCGRRETPHFLEHLLFAGTSNHTEAELDALIRDYGGYWNATTSTDDTIYEVDLYSPYTDEGLDLLYEIVTDSTMSEERVAVTRDIIHRESGGKPSNLDAWLYDNGIGKSGLDKAAQFLSQGCTRKETAENITRDDIVATFNRYYVPNNMTLIVVGDFLPHRVREKIIQTFGRLPASTVSRVSQRLATAYTGPLRLSGTLNPPLGSDAWIALAFPTNGFRGSDYYAHTLIATYLDFVLYDALRTESGLAYAPSVELVNNLEHGALLLSADVDLEHVQDATAIIQRELDKLRTDPLDASSFEAVKRQELLSRVQGIEANSDIADYYANSAFELKLYGDFVDEEERITALTPADIHKAAQQLFSPDKQLVIINEPTLTYGQLALLLAGLCTFLALIVFRRKLFKKNA